MALQALDLILWDCLFPKIEHGYKIMQGVEFGIKLQEYQNTSNIPSLDK